MDRDPRNEPSVSSGRPSALYRMYKGRVLGHHPLDDLIGLDHRRDPNEERPVGETTPSYTGRSLAEGAESWTLRSKPSSSESTDRRRLRWSQTKIESPGATSITVMRRNSPGPSPSPPRLRTYWPARSKILSSEVPEFAIRMRPSDSRAASATRNSCSSGAPSTTPIVSAGAAETRHAVSGVHRGGAIRDDPYPGRIHDGRTCARGCALRAATARRGGGRDGGENEAPASRHHHGNLLLQPINSPPVSDTTPRWR